MTTAYLAIDVQNDFIEGGSLGVTGGQAAADRLTQYLVSFDAPEVVVTTQDWHNDPGSHWSETPDFADSWPVHCAMNTKGAELYYPLAQVLDLLGGKKYVAITKGESEAAYSGFQGFNNNGVPLAQVLREAGVTRLQVGGIATDYCVLQTVLDALREGFEVDLMTDHIAAVSETTGQDALEKMRTAGANLV